MPHNRAHSITTLRAAALLCVAAFLSACAEPTGLQATSPTQTSVVSIYALSGTPSGYPSALSIPANQAVSIDGTLLFDVVFDLDSEQRAVLYPMSLIVWNRVPIHPVGMLKSADEYDDLARAPATGYNYADALIVSVGDVVVIESNDSRPCGFPFPAKLYAKLVVDAIDLPARALRLRMTQNPNCGFRSFLAGIPED